MLLALLTSSPRQDPESFVVVTLGGVSVTLPPGTLVINSSERQALVRRWPLEGDSDALETRLLILDGDPDTLSTPHAIKSALDLPDRMFAKFATQRWRGIDVPFARLSYDDHDGTPLHGYCGIISLGDKTLLIQVMTTPHTRRFTKGEVLTIMRMLPETVRSIEEPTRPIDPGPVLMALFYAGIASFALGWFWITWTTARTGYGGYALAMFVIPILAMVKGSSDRELVWPFRACTAGFLILLGAYLYLRIIN